MLRHFVWPYGRILRRSSLALAVLFSLACAAHADNTTPPASPAPAAQPTAPPAAAPAAPAKTFTVKSDAQADPAPAATAPAATAPAPAPKAAKPAATKPATTKPAAKSPATAKSFTAAKPAPAAKPAAPVPTEPDPGQAYIKPFPGSRQIARASRNYDDYWMALGKLHGESQADKVELIGGRWIHAAYMGPNGPAVAEVFRHYEQQVTKAGLEIVYSCSGTECGEGGRKTNGDWWDMTYQRRFLVAQLERRQGDLWVCVHVQAKGPNVAGTHDVDVIEAKPEPREEKVVADETDAGWLEHELNESGHVAVRGIGFDPKKLTVLGSSSRTMDAVAQLFSRDPRRKLMVVVHGDGSGDPKTDVPRCRREAAAIVQELVKKHGVAPSRVQGDGVGPLAPVASSATPEGRALNRRVELVLQNPMPDLKASRNE